MLNYAEAIPLHRRQEWRNQAILGTHEPDRAKVTAAVNSLYQCQKLQPPTIVFCDGPLHMIAHRCLLPHMSTSEESMSELEYMTFFGENMKLVLENAPYNLQIDDPLEWALLATSLYRSFFFDGSGRSTAAVPSHYYLEQAVTAGIWSRRAVADAVEPLPDEVPLNPLNSWSDAVNNSSRRYASMAWNFALSIEYCSWWHWLSDAWTFERNLPYEGKQRLQDMCVIASQCLGFAFLQRYAFIVRKPTEIHYDARGLAHNPSGPSFAWPDGFKTYCLHGISVQQQFVSRPITVQDILSEQNSEVRRVLIEEFGAERFMYEFGANLVHSDDSGELYKTLLSGEDLAMVRVRNSTAEPDGTFRFYMLRVPPDMQRARQAVAWTFGLEESEYDPARET